MSFNDEGDQIVKALAGQSKATQESSNQVVAGPSISTPQQMNESSKPDLKETEGRSPVTTGPQANDAKTAIHNTASNRQWVPDTDPNAYFLNRYFDGEHSNRVLALSVRHNKKHKQET